MKISKLLACVIGLSSLLGAETPINPWRVEPRIAAFVPSSSRIEDTYGVAPSYQLLIGREFSTYGDFWVNFDWVTMSGHHRHQERTRMNIGNAGVGLSLFFPIDCWNRNRMYFGAGPSVAGVWIREQNHDPEHKKCVVGALFKLGYQHVFDCRWVLDLFVDYLHQHAHFRREDNIGGTKLGAGFGVKF